MRMDSEKLEQLLKKYWDCETSLEEEQQLRAYFRSGDVPDNLKEVATLFSYFEESRKKTITDIDFDRNVMSRISTRSKGKRIQLMNNALRIAAGISVLIVAGWFVTREVRSSMPEDTFENPDVAFQETKKALLMISRSFVSAQEKAKKVSIFNEAQETVQKDDSKESNL